LLLHQSSITPTQEIQQTADGLRRQAVDGTQKATGDLLKKLDRGAKYAVSTGLKRAGTEVKKQLGDGPAR